MRYIIYYILTHSSIKVNSGCVKIPKRITPSEVNFLGRCMLFCLYSRTYLRCFSFSSPSLYTSQLTPARPPQKRISSTITSSIRNLSVAMKDIRLP